METGRSSPIWDPMFWVVFIWLIIEYGRSEGGKRSTCFNFCKKVFANVDDFAERHFGVLPLMFYSDLCSRIEDEGRRTCLRALEQGADLGKENSAIRRLASSSSRDPGVQNSSCCE